jgi:DNA-binding response OmpR family regulator
MSKKILVVDDEPDIVKVLVARLKEHGYQCITAGDGNKALVMAGEFMPDLIILDIMMPGMDGTEAAQKLRENPRTKDIPIIFLSALQTKSNEKQDGDKSGGNIILAKPFDINVLVAKIKKMTSGD